MKRLLKGFPVRLARRIVAELERREERRLKLAVGMVEWLLRPEAVLACIGPAVRQAREALGISRAELARAAGSCPDVLADLEHGRSRPSLDLLARLAACLGLRPSELLQRAEHAAGTLPEEERMLDLAE